MNLIRRRKFSAAAARGLCALLAALALAVNAPAQPAPPTSPQRWLLVFELSAEMKDRQPATAEVLKNFFATGAYGRLQPGDSIGVWTFDQKLHAGQFPLTIWNTNPAPAVAGNVAAFLQSRNYAGKARLSLLQPALNSIAANSERFTVVIFCTGESDLSGTPYDLGVNQIFRNARAERRKHRQPFVVLMRTWSGKYLGCTVNYPPGPMNIPPFPRPAPPTNQPPPVTAPVVVPVGKQVTAAVPDLIIVGTNVGGTMPPAPAPAVTSSAPVEIPPPAPPPVVLPVVPVMPAVTNIPPVAKPVPAPAPVPVPTPVPAPTSAPAPPALTALTNRPPAVTTTNLPPAANTTNLAGPPPVLPPLLTELLPTTNLTAPAVPASLPPVETGAAAGRPPAGLLVLIGVGLLLLAVLIVLLLLLLRSGRRSQGSLISRSMADDPRHK